MATNDLDSRFYHLALPDATQTGWYYQAREGVFGPFASRESAQFDLAHRIAIHPMRREEMSDRVEESTDKASLPSDLADIPSP